jgi:uncharacterized protein (TIGR02001 family)
MGQRSLSLLGCLLLAPLASAAPPQWGGSAVLASDYLQRGVSRSQEEPALSGELHMQSGHGLFAAVWASTTRARDADATTVELSATLGISRPLGEDWTGRLGVTHYESPWASFPGFYSYDEVSADLIYRERLYLGISFSPDTSRYSPTRGPVWNRNAAAYEAGYQQTFTNHLRGSAGIGYYDLTNLFDKGYWYGSAGVSLTQGRWRLDLSYVATSDSAKRLSYEGVADNRALASLTVSF